MQERLLSCAGVHPYKGKRRLGLGPHALEVTVRNGEFLELREQRQTETEASIKTQPRHFSPFVVLYQTESLCGVEASSAVLHPAFIGVIFVQLTSGLSCW